MTPLMEIERIKIYSGKNEGKLKGACTTGKKHKFIRSDCWSSANKISSSKKYPFSHPWYINGSDKVSVTGHHILSVSGVKAAAKTKHGIILETAKYDTNHCKNIVALPTLSQLACELRVPIHYGNHTGQAIPDMKTNMSYHIFTTKMVVHMLKLLRKKGVCPGDSESDSREVLINIDYLSCIKLRWISNFEVLLHKFGKDYKEGGAGCRGIIDNLEKDKNEANSCIERYHGFNLSDSVANMKYNDRLKTVFELENMGKGLEYET
ncbi:AHH domain-containing protein [Vibrio parahaemolyticus]|uniref:AHH domain-containing protein n=1 Tax=Vibrio parahaemolyticus TaxID=670 RepID=UPI00084B8E21|nr:AHH domain-containing protein [Vibrio parahaemolyticus]MBM5007909.1 AHH domain-containing protein [Vibrio parahaemolyticus]MCQ9079593.1 AHH domain-containing protein [Vibrio parahaemolyticus]ODY20933.1 hypothetical protein BBM17_01935 [Vibrio parahaemolyticus]HCG7308605.1 AHH domain-containing protein [Vibrio parahaemolyticus]